MSSRARSNRRAPLTPADGRCREATPVRFAIRSSWIQVELRYRRSAADHAAPAPSPRPGPGCGRRLVPELRPALPRQVLALSRLKVFRARRPRWFDGRGSGRAAQRWLNDGEARLLGERRPRAVRENCGRGRQGGERRDDPANQYRTKTAKSVTHGRAPFSARPRPLVPGPPARAHRMVGSRSWVSQVLLYSGTPARGRRSPGRSVPQSVVAACRPTSVRRNWAVR